MTQQYKNFPFLEVVAEAEKLIKQGWTLFQKFSCEKCMRRLTMPDENKFYTVGHCEHCNVFTDIMKTGCNYTAVMSSDPVRLQKLIVEVRSNIEREELRQRRAKMT